MSARAFFSAWLVIAALILPACWQSRGREVHWQATRARKRELPGSYRTPATTVVNIIDPHRTSSTLFFFSSSSRPYNCEFDASVLVDTRTFYLLQDGIGIGKLDIVLLVNELLTTSVRCNRHTGSSSTSVTWRESSFSAFRVTKIYVTQIHLSGIHVQCGYCS